MNSKTLLFIFLIIISTLFSYAYNSKTQIRSKKNLSKEKLTATPGTPSQLELEYQANLHKENCKLADVHNPFKVQSESDRNYFYCYFSIVFFLIYYLFKILYNYCFDIDHFTKRAIKLASTADLQLFFFVLLINIINHSGTFDSYSANIEALLTAFAIISIGWFLINFFIIILLSPVAIEDWRNFEKHVTDMIYMKDGSSETNQDNKSIRSQESVKRSVFFAQKILRQIDEDNKRLEKLKSKEIRKFALLKAFFCSPQFPFFKSSNLDYKTFNFGNYLENCLLENLEALFSFSLTTYAFILANIGIWYVVITNSSVIFGYLSIMITCLILIISFVITLIYLSKKYDDLLPIDNKKDNKEIENVSSSDKKSTNLPVYLREYLTSDLSDNSINSGFNSIFRNRLLSPYEDTFCLGFSGLGFAGNIIQVLTLGAIIWPCVAFFYHTNDESLPHEYIVGYYVLSLIYILSAVVLASYCLKNYTLLNSLEMSRNEKALLSTISELNSRRCEIHNKIVSSFKLLYFYMKLYDCDFTTKEEMCRFYTPQEVDNLTTSELNIYYLLEMVFFHFKIINSRNAKELARIREHLQNFGYQRILNMKKTSQERVSLDIDMLDESYIYAEELARFLSSSGTPMSKGEINRIKRYLRINLNNPKEPITLGNLKNVMLVNIKMSNMTSSEIICDVLGNYLSKKTNSEKSETKNEVINFQTVGEFLNEYQFYFSIQEHSRILELSESLGEECSIFDLSHSISLARKEFPN